MAEADGRAIATGTPEAVLVERAGAAVARHAERMLAGAYGRRVVVVAGKGNNGADGIVAARRLAGRGIGVAVFELAEGIDRAAFSRAQARADLAVDAMFGTGFRGVLAGDAAFVARPHAGAGTTKAALDAACLADSIRDAGDDLDLGLQRYQRMQEPFGRALVEVNREEGAYLSAQLKPKGERTAAELNRDIGAVLRAHIDRSDQVGDIVAAHGLTALAGA